MEKNIINKINFLHNKAKALIKQEIEEEKIISELMKEGIDKDYAKMIIANVEGNIDDKRDFWKLFIMGFFFIFAGLLINFFSNKMAVVSNSFFFYLFWGIVVYGIIMIYRAFSFYKHNYLHVNILTSIKTAANWAAVPGWTL
jgi:hypothetical protein